MIAYEHTHTEAVNWSVEDSFQFVVYSSPASLEPQEFHIIISYDIVGRSSRLLANAGEVLIVKLLSLLVRLYRTIGLPTVKTSDVIADHNS